MMFSSRHPFLFRSAVVAAFLFCALTAGSLRAEENPPVDSKCALGATPAQISALYGPVLRHNARVRRHQILEGGTVIDGDLYSRNGLVIRVVYYAEVAVLLEYTRVDGVLTAQDAKLLLAANTNTATWLPGKENTETNFFYHRSDNKAVAHFTTDNDGSLLIAAENTGHDFLSDRLLEGH